MSLQVILQNDLERRSGLKSLELERRGHVGANNLIAGFLFLNRQSGLSVFTSFWDRSGHKHLSHVQVLNRATVGMKSAALSPGKKLKESSQKTCRAQISLTVSQMSKPRSLRIASRASANSRLSSCAEAVATHNQDAG
jgi:hypothetical protein